MNKLRFSNFNLLTIQYPFTAIISILHRLSGVLVFLMIPLLLGLLESALSNASEFASIQTLLTNPVSKLTVWFFLAALGYHFVAGVRHLLMDIGYAESLHAAKQSGMRAFGIALAWTVLVGVWLW